MYKDPEVGERERCVGRNGRVLMTIVKVSCFPGKRLILCPALG